MITGYIGECTPKAKNVWVRAAPSGKKVGALKYGLTAPLVVHCDKWLRVAWNGDEAYIAAHVVVVTMDKRV